jgi:cation transport regulator
MPYKTDAELPESVRNALPKHGQDIYRKAFNSAWAEYADASKRRGSESQEEAAHKVAWAAVKDKYAKDDASGAWQPKS